MLNIPPELEEECTKAAVMRKRGGENQTEGREKRKECRKDQVGRTMTVLVMKNSRLRR